MEVYKWLNVQGWFYMFGSLFVVMLCYVMLWKASWILCTYDVNVNDSRGVKYPEWCYMAGSLGLQVILCGMS